MLAGVAWVVYLSISRWNEMKWMQEYHSLGPKPLESFVAVFGCQRARQMDTTSPLPSLPNLIFLPWVYVESLSLLYVIQWSILLLIYVVLWMNHVLSRPGHYRKCYVASKVQTNKKHILLFTIFSISIILPYKTKFRYTYCVYLRVCDRRAETHERFYSIEVHRHRFARHARKVPFEKCEHWRKVCGRSAEDQIASTL